MASTGGALQKYKIVFLGDQSVGKTSIINRFIFDNFTGNEQVPIQMLSVTSANSGHRFHFEDVAGRQQDSEVAVMGHGWAGTFQIADSQLHPGFVGRHRLLRCDQYRIDLKRR
jgi:GTPase SAR1 family protein